MQNSAVISTFLCVCLWVICVSLSFASYFDNSLSGLIQKKTKVIGLCFAWMLLWMYIMLTMYKNFVNNKQNYYAEYTGIRQMLVLFG